MITAHNNKTHLRLFFSTPRFRNKDKVVFIKRLAFLLQANISVVESLTIIRNQTAQTTLREVYDQIIYDLTTGKYLSTSLARYRKLFGSLIVHVIEAGESSGTLTESLTHLAEELTKRQELKSKIYSALIYPIFITVTTFSVTGLLVTYIFPKILPIFSSLNITLPLSTKILLELSVFLRDWGLISVTITTLLIFVWVKLHHKYLVLQHITSNTLLRLPIVGNLIRSYNCANFCRTLSLNLRSGISLTEALTITSSVTDNAVYKSAYEQLCRQVWHGQKISSTMLAYPKLFPEMLTQLVLIGETTGALSASLQYLATFYENEVGESTRNLSSLIEPLLLIVMGVLVGIIAVSVITPIYEVTQMLGSTR